MKKNSVPLCGHRCSEGGFTRETFQQFTGRVDKIITLTLLNRSLISHGYARRYDMHPLLRQYAQDKLEAAGAVADARNAHLIMFLGYAQRKADRMYDGQHYLESLEALEIEQDNFRVALDWALKRKQHRSGCRTRSRQW